MPRFIIKLVDGADAYYMNWSTIVDAPVSRGMTLEELHEDTRVEHGESGLRELPARLERVERQGTSQMHDAETADEAIAFNRAGPRETQLNREEILNVYCRPAEQRARELALKLHAKQRYGAEPYAFHLNEVRDVLANFGVKNDQVLAAGWLHDALEDTDVTLDFLQRNFPEDTVAIVDACTDGPGKNRAERKQRPMHMIPKVDGAIIVKLADRIANVQACVRGGNNDLLGMYRREHEAFRAALKDSRPKHRADAMWQRLEELLAP